MTAIRKHPSEADLWRRYTHSPAGSKQVLRLKSLVFLPTNKTVFLDCLARSGLRAPDGKAWASRSLNTVLEELLGQNLLTEDLSCPPTLLHPVAMDAAASTESEALVAAVLRAFPARRKVTYYLSGEQLDCEAMRRLIRLAIYVNDAAGFSGNWDLHHKNCGGSRAADLLSLLFATVPLAPDWLASRRPVIQLALFDAKLSAFLRSGVSGPDMPALLDHFRAQQDKEDFAASRPALLLLDLLAGRLDDVQRGIAAVEDPVGTTRQALEGTVAFLRGRNEAALQHYRDALKLHRKHVGKRKVFLDGVHGLFFLMALLRANDAALQAEMQAGLDAELSNPSIYVGGFRALQALLWLAQGLEPKARELLGQLRAAMPVEPLSAACVALAEHAVDARLAHTHQADLHARFERLQAQMPLVARIYAEILASAAASPGPYQAYLSEAGQGVEAAFTQIIQMRQPWERALESLDAFLGASASKAASGSGPQKAKRLALQAGFRLALSGTPVENDLDELWSLFNFVNPGLLGSREGFGKRFATPIERDRDAQARQALRSLIRPFLLRRTKAAVLSELPPRTEQTMLVEMGEAERAFYEAMRQRALENIAALDAPQGKRKIYILAEITRLRRACCNPALIDPAAGLPSGKLDALLDLVDDLLRNRHRALVFSQFVGHLGLVRAALDARGIRYEYLDGSTPSAERERRVAAFQAGGAELFLISLRAGGTGLNLTAADYVIHLDPWWNPAVEDQASDRAHRIGQERPVTIYRLIMQDSIEERIVRLHRDKRDLVSDLLEGTETSARLSEEELLDLIRA